MSPSLLVPVGIRPRQLEKTSPCCADCVTGTDVRGWIAVIAQRRKLGLTDRQAYTRAWSIVARTNPFPATLGRICPHPCESGCRRGERDGGVAVNALERFLGDWALRQRLALPMPQASRQPESIGVIGAGPAGLSFAYQMARRGYRVTVYEKQGQPGGMLRYGIPRFRLPEDVREAEVRRLLDTGVELRLGTSVGSDVPVHELQQRHAAVFLGIGAGRGRRLGIAGEDGAGVWTGTQYLAACSVGTRLPIGARVVVVGGGNTAIDAARCARRDGARVTILYRRSRADMPAIAGEVEEALAEGVRIDCQTVPSRIERDGDAVRAVVVQRARPVEGDACGPGRWVADGEPEFELAADSVIVAVAQETDWSELDGFRPCTTSEADRMGAKPEVRVGGDAVVPSIAGVAIAQGRRAAESVHARLRGLPHPSAPPAGAAGVGRAVVKPDYYPAKDRVSTPLRSVEARMARPDVEVGQTLSEEAFLDEVSRCCSCGLCFGCEHCSTYCNAGSFTRLEQVQPGAYFTLGLDACEGCGKCIEVCPCGFLGAE